MVETEDHIPGASGRGLSNMMAIQGFCTIFMEDRRIRYPKGWIGVMSRGQLGVNVG